MNKYVHIKLHWEVHDVSIEEKHRKDFPAFFSSIGSVVGNIINIQRETPLPCLDRSAVRTSCPRI